MSFMWRRGVPMRVRGRFMKHTAWSLTLVCTLAAVVSPAAAQQTVSSPDVQLPDSPSATLAKLQPPALPQGSQQAAPAPTAPPAPQSQQNQATQSQAQPAQQRPEGTAAAEPTHAGGVAASQPAGVAIAPDKQHRARTIIIRVGAIIGAAAAVGAVVALTEATGSKPPGAH
jgi:hypothetical protein